MHAPPLALLLFATADTEMLIDFVITEVLDAATWCLGRMLVIGGGAADGLRPVLFIDSLTTARIIAVCDDKAKSKRIWERALLRHKLGFNRGEAPASLCVVAGVVHEGLHYWNYVIDPEKVTLEVENTHGLLFLGTKTNFYDTPSGRWTQCLGVLLWGGYPTGAR